MSLDIKKKRPVNVEKYLVENFFFNSIKYIFAPF